MIRFMMQLLYLIVGLVLVSCSAPQVETDVTEYDAVYYLVRHAEKTAQKPDPGLTIEGQKRAQDLALRLKDVLLTEIYSSDYIRTLDTAAPIAKDKAMAVTLYDPRKLEEFSKTLLRQEGHILVVGHSNTTPQLSELLGGQGGTPIIEATEYNRFYIIKRDGDVVKSEIQIFGD